jgi:hypothetical protein
MRQAYWDAAILMSIKSKFDQFNSLSIFSHSGKLAEPVNLLAIGDITGCRLLRSLRYMVKTTRIERRN